MSDRAAERSPDWLDRDRYPFASNWFDTPEGRVHYLDEGTGRPVVFLHGNPTWSFLYRDLVGELSDAYRCVAPDLLGFGLSERPRDFSHRPADHATVLARLLEALDLRDAVFVGHDWGGPIALDHATRHPDAVRGVVAMNTWMWPRDRPLDRALDAATGGRVWRRLVRRHNAFARLALGPLSAALAVREGREHAAAVRRHYLGPLASPADRTGTWVLSRSVFESGSWLAHLWARRRTLADVPALLAWGRRDPVHGGFLDRWRAAFPDASATVFDAAGHFVPEEAGRDLVAAVRAFLDAIVPP